MAAALPATALSSESIRRTVHCHGALTSSAPDRLVSTHAAVYRLVRDAKQIALLGAVNASLGWDVSDCQDLDPGAVLLLFHAAQQIGKLGYQTFATGDGPALKVLSDHLRHYHSPPDERRTIPKKLGDFLLREVRGPEHMVRELEEWAESVRAGTNATAEQVGSWQALIAEVTTNGIQHGKTGLGHPLPPMLLVGRAYAESHQVVLAALDRGAGMPRVIETVLNPTQMAWRDGRKIAHACKPGVTSHCVRQNQGAGLPSLIAAVKKNGGSLQMMSREGLVCVRKRVSSRSLNGLNAPLEGTLTVLTLRI
jgi:hypothetical protein